MRPALHMPAPASTMHAPATSLIAFDSFAVAVGFSVFKSSRSGRSAEELGHLVVEDILVLPVNLRRLDRHRAVEEDGERFHLAGAKHPREQQHNELRTADRERRHEHLAAALHRLLHDAHELIDRRFRSRDDRARRRSIRGKRGPLP